MATNFAKEFQVSTQGFDVKQQTTTDRMNDVSAVTN